MKWWKNQKLYVKILIDVILGIVLGIIFGPSIKVIKPIGDIFIRLLQMLIIPLTFFTIISGVNKLESIKKLQSIGGKIMLIYIGTSLLSVFIGSLIALTINPGKGEEGLLSKGKDIKQDNFNFVDNIVQWIPKNIIESMSETNMLQVIVFALFIGITMVFLGDRVKRIRGFVHEASDLMINFAEIIIKFAPYGILALVANVVGTMGTDMIMEIIQYVICAFLGFLIILIVVYPLLLFFIAKVNPIDFYKKVSPAMLIAFSTTSSSATLPSSMEVADKGLRIPESVYGFTLPLGATINMNGLASTLGVISVFAANLYNTPITFTTIIQTAFLGVALALGCAGVKGADIITASLLLSTLGLPLTLVPIIAAVSPIVDMGNTVVNITGDLVGTKIVHNTNKEKTQTEVSS